MESGAGVQRCREFAPQAPALVCDECRGGCVFCGSPRDLQHCLTVCQLHHAMRSCVTCGKGAAHDAPVCEKCVILQRHREGCVHRAE